MCGIVAITARSDSASSVDSQDLRRSLSQASRLVHSGSTTAELLSAAQLLARVNVALISVAGVSELITDPMLVADLAVTAAGIEAHLDEVQQRLDGPDGPVDDELEAANQAIGAVRDEVWSIARDRIRTAAAVGGLAGPGAPRSAVSGYLLVQLALSSIDRLEVRGRDSAGIHLLVWGHGLDLAGEGRALLGERGTDPLFSGGSVRADGDCLAFVYKAAAEIGDLGDNTASLRAQVARDALLRLALSAPEARCTVLGHTRWASVGIISEPNAHPLNSEESAGNTMASHGPYVAAALNGDVDNHADLRAAEQLSIPAEITTDAKVIPTLVSRVAATGVEMTESFRRTVARFEGSVAIGAVSSTDPAKVWLALRGSGQALYVGWTDEVVIAASEPYGLVELTRNYVRMDGETPANPDAPATSRGQVLVMGGDHGDGLASLVRWAYDGSPLPIAAREVVTAEVTTRDIDRGSFPHFLLKEISEAPRSFRNTLRGRIGTHDDGMLFARLGDHTIPPELAARLARREIHRVVVLGQGTAAVAGAALARMLSGLLPQRCYLAVEATTATEFSGFGLAPDLSDTLVIAVSQSGTTTDTNRTVDLARARGASVIAVVNRRGSDLCDKADGVMYTSDGRDVEMSVASTKAFYAQVAAGGLLACALSATAGLGDDMGRHELLDGLRALPDAMEVVLTRRPEIARAASAFAPSRRYWALVGNGPNHIAARELRIKFSELCYKSMGCDVTEDKKHIDLSCEPLIVVCAAGLSGSTADDVAKEVAIYRAHKAAAVVIATEGEERFAAAHQVITVPPTGSGLGFVLSAMAGHLFGYEAALAIDAQARSLREVRATVESCLEGLPDGDTVMARLAAPMELAAARFFDQLRTGAFNGHLEAATAVRLASVLRFAAQVVPLDAFAIEHGKVGTPQVLVEDLLAALTSAIDELTRPIDAIKHQAKTVTVGISRSDEGLLSNWLVQATLDAGAPRDRLSYRNLKTLADLAPAIAAVVGSVRYRIDDDGTDAIITVIDRAGIGRDLASRTDRDHRLRGTKHRVAAERELWAAKGRADGRTILLVPEVKGSQTTGMTLLHVRFGERLSPELARSVLSGYRNRYAQLTDVVTETEPAFRDDLLSSVTVTDLLTLPVQVLAEHWRSSGT